MVVGFNHNFRYKGEIYHIQTEDGGLKSPNIVTLLYRGGTILASKKTSYADITKVDNLEQVVEELMKEQHKNMLRSLKAAEFDAVIARYEASRGNHPTAGDQPKVAPQPAAPPQPTPAATPPPVSRPSAPPAAPRPAVTTSPTPRSAAPQAPKAPAEKPAAAQPAVPKSPSTVETSLDEIILSYLMGEEK